MSNQILKSEVSLSGKQNKLLKSSIDDKIKIIDGISKKEKVDESELDEQKLIDEKNTSKKRELKKMQTRKFRSEMLKGDSKVSSTIQNEDGIKNSDLYKRKVQSLPIRMTYESSISDAKCLLQNIPSDILNRCDSYEFCKACNEAMKNESDEKLISKSSQSSTEDHNMAMMSDTEKFSSELSNNEQSTVEMPNYKSSEALAYLSCPSVKVCRECSQMYQSDDNQVPLCESVDFCNSCNPSRKQTKIEAKSSLDSILSDISCYSYNDCEYCKNLHDLKKIKSAMHRNNEAYISNANGQSSKFKGKKSSVRPATVHNVYSRTQVESPKEARNSIQNDSQHIAKNTFYNLLKNCQSKDICNICSQRFSQCIEEDSSESSMSNCETHTKNQSIINKNLNFILERCDSKNFCQNCSKLSLLQKITTSNASYNHPIETCPSYNDCRNCQKYINTHPIETCTSFEQCDNCHKIINNASSRRSSLIASSPRLTLRKSIDGKIINIIPSKTSGNISAYAHGSQHRCTNTPLSYSLQTCEVHSNQNPLNSSSSAILNSCKSFGLCKKCTDRIINSVKPEKSFVATNCNSYDTCNKCAQILRAKSSKSKIISSKLSKLSRKSSISQRASTSPSMQKSSNISKSNLSKSSSGQELYEIFKSKIDEQNNIVSDIQLKIKKIASINSADLSLVDLKSKLDTEKDKLRGMLKVAMHEQRISKDASWKPFKITLIDDLS
ncbi:hypothetical protein PVAND_005437 [Polypedilum vanderplanki]|uniref:Uncharacterized protein n=1 Tax=Polypedilum vanderplanki TaxID=319348 RepID=A0A9J6C116_POLVA|nr:hypothetical protein PVAND_005437 [Polypedilum vanderplanki]